VRREGRGRVLRALLAGAAAGAALALGPFACSTAASLAAAGGHCSTVDDCQDGLICCNGNKGTFTCMSSAACILPSGSTPADAGNGNPAPADDAAGRDTGNPGPEPDAARGPDGATPVPEASTADTSRPPADTGVPEDTGSPPQEAAPPPPDAGDDAPTSD
jgi:hypothetical protein